MAKLIIFFAIIIIVIALVVSFYEEKEWQSFSKENHCKVIKKESSSNSFGTVNGETLSIYTPGKTTYKCDDESIFVR